VHHGALVVGHIEVELRVRIGVLELGDDGFGGPGFGAVVRDVGAVVREDGALVRQFRHQHERRSGDGGSEAQFHVFSECKNVYTGLRRHCRRNLESKSTEAGRLTLS
jgi:hypothetical protein